MAQVTKHQDYSGKYCPHRTLDYGWDRFKGMIQSELNQLNKPAIEWINDNPANYIAITDTALYNVVNGQVVKAYPAGTQLEFVQHATHNGKAYYRTAYSRDHSIDNGMPITDFAQVESPEKESVKWEDIGPIKFITGEDCNLLKIQTQEVVKTFQPGETLEFVQKTTYAGTVYYRTAYSKGKKVHNGVPEYALLPYNDPGREQPVEPDVLPEVKDPDPDQEYDEAMAKGIWAQIFDLVVKFIKAITGQRG